MDQTPNPKTMKRKSGRPTHQAAVALTERILDAAEASFIAKGFQDTTIQDLAAQCGIMRRSIISRFRSKEELLIAVAKREMNSYSPQLFALKVRQEHCWEDLEALIRKLWERGTDARRSALLRAYLGETVRLPQLADAVRAFYYDISANIEQKIVEMQRYGMFRNYKASTVANCAIALIVADPRVRTMLFDPAFNDPVQVERYFTDIWTLIRQMA